MKLVSRRTTLTWHGVGLVAMLFALAPASAQTPSAAPRLGSRQVDARYLDAAQVHAAGADLPSLATPGQSRAVFGRRQTPANVARAPHAVQPSQRVAQNAASPEGAASSFGSRFSQTVNSWFSRDESGSTPPDASPIAQAAYGEAKGKYPVQQAHRVTGGNRPGASRQLATRKTSKSTGGLLGRWLNSKSSAKNPPKDTATASRGQAKPVPRRVAGDNSKAPSTSAKKRVPAPRSLVRIGDGAAKPLKQSLPKSGKPSDGVAFVSDAPVAETVTPRQKTAPLPRVAKPLVKKSSPVFVSDSGRRTPPASKATGESIIAGAMAMVSSGESLPSKRVAPLPQGLTGGVAPLPKPMPKVASPRSKPAAEPKLVAITNGPVMARRLPKGEETSKPVAKSEEAAKPVVASAKPSKRAVEILSKACQDAAVAKGMEAYTQIVQQCRHVLAIDDAKVVVDYANELGAWALNKRGELRADAGENADAITDFDEAVKMDVKRWRAYHNRGVLLAQSGQYDEALTDFNAVIAINPKFAKAYANRAALGVQEGDFAAALEDYRSAIALDPDLAVAHKGRGRVCHMLGRMDEALRHFDAAVLLSPDDAHIACCRADLLVDNGRYSQAIAGYRQAIALDPSLASSYRNLAWLHATCPEERFRDGATAVDLATKALGFADGEDEVTLDTLAAAQAASGDFESAVSLMRRAIDAASGADTKVYNDRLRLYEQGRVFLSKPVTTVRQASYQQ